MNNKSQEGSILSILLILIGVIFLVGLGFFLASSLDFKGKRPNSFELTTPPEIVKLSSKISFEPLPDVDSKAYPVLDGKKMILVPLSGYENPPAIELKSEGGGGASGLGTTSPLVSPDLKKIAFIDENVLKIVTSDGKHLTQLPKELEVEYITAWSPDSKKLLVNSPRVSLEDVFGYGVDYYKKFNPQKMPGGFYLLEMDSGSVVYLEPLENFVNWVDSNTILSSVSFPMVDRYAQENYILFNLNTYSTNAKVLEGQFDEYFGKSFSFNSDGKKWAISLGNTENSPGGSYSNIIVADFPETKGVTVAEGTWAEIQGPILSPNGNKLIYVNHQPPSGWFTVYWDGKDKKLLQSGQPSMWVNDDQFIMTGFETLEDKTLTHIYLYDIPSGQETKLY